MGGRAEVRSRLYWIIKRNWVALITLLLRSLSLASYTDRAETLKQRLHKRKRYSATVCVQPARSLPELRLSSSLDHNIVPHCIAAEQSCPHRPWALPPAAPNSLCSFSTLHFGQNYMASPERSLCVVILCSGKHPGKPQRNSSYLWSYEQQIWQPDTHFTPTRLSVLQERGRNMKGVGIKKHTSEREQQRQRLYSLVRVSAGLC